MSKLNIVDEIKLHRDDCKGLLKKFEEGKLAYEDFAYFKDKHDTTPLHFVICYCGGEGVLDLVKYLVKLDPNCVKNHNINWELPLHWAIERRSFEITKLLLSEFPAGAKERDINGDLPLHYAMERRDENLIEILLKAYPEGISVRNNNDQTPVDMLTNCLACEEHKETIVSLTKTNLLLDKQRESEYREKLELMEELKEAQVVAVDQALDFGTENSLKVRMKCLQEARKSESQLLDLISQNCECEPREMLKSLLRRHKDMKSIVCPEAKLSMTHIAASALLKDETPSRDHLLETIIAMDKELTQLECTAVPSVKITTRAAGSTPIQLSQDPPPEISTGDLSKKLMFTPIQKSEKKKRPRPTETCHVQEDNKKPKASTSSSITPGQSTVRRSRRRSRGNGSKRSVHQRDDFYFFGNLIQFLQLALDWDYKKGTKLKNWLIIRGDSKLGLDGEVGVDYFEDEDAVVEYCVKNKFKEKYHHLLPAITETGNGNIIPE